MPTNRTMSWQGALTRMGFVDAGSAARELESGPLGALSDIQRLAAEIGRAADPDLALRALNRVVETGQADDVLDLLDGAGGKARERLIAVLGSSNALGDHLVRHPQHWRDLEDLDVRRRPGPGEVRAGVLRAVGAAPEATEPVSELSVDTGKDALRVEYARRLMQIAGLDLVDGLGVDDVGRDLADLAAAVLEGALAIARAELAHGPHADLAPCRLAVIGMGKVGGRELNYVSDVDVIFVAEPRDSVDDMPPDSHADTHADEALRAATELATSVMRICSDHTAEGTIWPVDAALRPEGKAGPLVRTVDSHATYYRSWAQTWEFQALLKARPVAGDPELGRGYVEAIEPLVWTAADRSGFVDDVRRMRRRVEEHVRPTEAERQVKLGRGGIRDVEFAVQLLQLVHGRGDDALRSTSTTEALGALTDGGYVGREDGAALGEAYRFLRTLEHRLQLRRLRRTHVLPTEDAALRVLARSMGMRSAHEVQEAWRAKRREVRRLHEKIFYRPLIAAVADLPTDEMRLSPKAAHARLEALGYRDPQGAMRHLDALTKGVSRRAAIQRTLLPVLLGWFADSPSPDAGLAGFRKVSDALGTTPWYLRLLRDDAAAGERMARVLASGRYATELLMRSPDAVRILGSDSELEARSVPTLVNEVTRAVRRHEDPVDAIGVVRSIRRRELFRTSVADLVSLATVETVGTTLTDIAHVTLTGALDVAVRAVEHHRGEQLPTRIGVVAMGRLGGGEMNYGSDADVLFVHDPLPGADENEAGRAATEVAQQMRRLLSMPSPEPALTLDLDLRPEGRRGPVVRTLSGYASYYQRWAELWERQALLRASPACGDPDLLHEFTKVIDPLRWLSGGLDEDGVRKVRRMKARIESERLPRGGEPALHLKLGPGGQSDVEWTLQLIQLRHAGEVPELRTPRTVEGLQNAVAAGLLADDDCAELLRAWRSASAVRNAIVLVTSKPSDMVPRDADTLSAVSRLLGWEPGESAAFLDEYRRQARHSRSVVERVFYET
ncbi:MAG TPA: bifunctional [glutamine synthetase] adenylyltransferase/[glutamine synthetase]-adenylyl-L-tyrosine phosphorylase [Jiangellaceae bacterium]|nr:bifunctional [glutamine synthetase] adenylyltransferase/[glutamine synthetase]-adenylyl-L-tyrosine phosphorylase [Jiangellaceae bacterium]